MLVRHLLLLLSVVGIAFSVPTDKRALPTVQLDQGTFVGTSDGVASKFLGIPFGKAPVGDLRFNLPVAVEPYTGTHVATSFGPACPQQAFDFPELSGLAENATNFIVNSIFQVIEPSAEDCLSINVVVPAGTKPDAKLPVAVWIFGGGFELGGTSMYDGGVIVKRSIELGEPIVYVSMNYRVSAYGFLASKEVKEAGVGNLGLQDQRLALRWVQKYIGAFGGDPTKVTIWGESAGAISVALHMVTNGGNTEGLFRGGFMQSGSPIPVGDISSGQGDYDKLVAETGCSGAADTLQCLRDISFKTLKAAVDKSPGIFSPQSLKLTWLPRADGKFLPDDPQKLVQQGSVANVPFVTGDCDDEGTLFSLSTLNITTEAGVRDYIVSNYIPEISETDLDQLLEAYPADITQGSPFNTSVLNALTPEFKRLAAMQGDLVFQAPRRFFLQNRSSKQSTWSFLNKRLKGLPALGTAHGTDIINVYGGGDMTDYLVNFVNNLDPNGKTGISWPKYTTSSPKLLTFLDGVTPLTITKDDYRVDGFNLLTKLSLEFPL
ncbi:carotenoid ester lipase precursor [Lentinus brumalis]|uniref:Carboxylic ester hydrolase n=1 Tax=Lentinus brumalis TaxID=2498619 RepID=A0A371D8M7_9APHY|nr:carotenoid ester lipase precursor [Polyporus brumalis]